MRFARWTFFAAGIWGLLVILPMYFGERSLTEGGAPLNYPEYYYGFAGVVLAWQVAFLVVGTDPVRYRLFMPVAVLEKVPFIAAVIWLVAQGRTAPHMLWFAGIDALWAVLFTIAFVRLGSVSDPKSEPEA